MGKTESAAFKEDVRYNTQDVILLKISAIEIHYYRLFLNANHGSKFILSH
jgi:hypothetical protein